MISQQQREAVKEKCKEVLETFDGWLMDEINGCDTSIIFEKNADIYTKYRKQRMDEVVGFIIGTVKKQNIHMNIITTNKLKKVGYNHFTLCLYLNKNIYIDADIFWDIFNMR